MIIAGFNYTPFEITLKEAFENAGYRIQTRKGLIVEIIDELGNKAYGEICPLPGYSLETIDLVRAKLEEIKQLIVDSELDSGLFESIAEFPSLKFGISQALFTIFILRNGFDPEQKYITSILVNGVIGILPKIQVLSEVEKFLKTGFETVKIKVGRESIDKDVEIVKLITRNFGNKVKLRLDANSMWNIEQTRYFIKIFSGHNIEYIEQPVKEIEELIELSRESSVPIALDESIERVDIIPDLIKNSKIIHFVLKPSIMGSMNELVDVIRLLQSKERKAIISSAFESAVGRSALVYLASLSNHNSSHGLAVSNYFQNDIADDEFPIKNGRIEFSQRNYPPNFNMIKV